MRLIFGVTYTYRLFLGAGRFTWYTKHANRLWCTCLCIISATIATIDTVTLLVDLPTSVKQQQQQQQYLVSAGASPAYTLTGHLEMTVTAKHHDNVTW